MKEGNHSMNIRMRAPGAPSISGERLLRNIAEFAAVGRDPAGGITRAGFDAADRAARELLIDKTLRAGLVPQVDAAGNIIVQRRQGVAPCADSPVILIGSHLDTVVNGGRLDGAYGVLSALEVLQTIEECGASPSAEPVAIAFANEEGALFPQPFWGSMALAGRTDELPDDPRSHDNRPLAQALTLAGGNLSELKSATWPRQAIAAYLELHIEQGPVLEDAGRRIGVVESITGRTVLTVHVDGVSGHAGTVPMADRRDALAVAARIVTRVRKLSRDDRLCRVATVGRLDTYPNSPNTIASMVRLTIDLRDTDAARAADAEDTLRRELATLAAEERVTIDVEAATRTPPVRTDPRLRTAIARSAEDLGLTYSSMPSGAGHDAQIVADCAPIGMIFTPSKKGVSHVPEEDTDDADLVAGAQVLLHTALRI